MDFVYIDPGYGAGLDGMTCIESEEYNPINGVAYTIANTGGGDFALPVPSGVFTLSAMNQIKVVTVRFSVYLDLYISGRFRVGFYGAKEYSRDFTNAHNGFHDVAISRYAKIQLDSTTGYIYKTIVDIDSDISETDIANYTTVQPTTTQATMLSYAFGNSIAFHIPPPDSNKCYISNVMKRSPLTSRPTATAALNSSPKPTHLI